jgi:hypothetical protein
MVGFTINSRFWGVAKAMGRCRSRLCGLPTQPIFWPCQAIVCFPASEPSLPDSWPLRGDPAAARGGPRSLREIARALGCSRRTVREVRDGS